VKHYLLFYEVADDYVSKRAAFRDEHLARAWEAIERGEMVLAGALADPADGAVLLFKGDSPEAAERFAKADPYVTSGAVKRWYVREWTTVVGRDAVFPIGAKPTASAEASKSSDGMAEPDQLAKPSIVRMWRGHSATANSEQYSQHATRKVFPKLRDISGYRGAYLLRRNARGETEFVVLTLWDSMDAVRKFAGAEPEKAVVEPEARSALTDFDESVLHYEIVHGSQEGD